MKVEFIEKSKFEKMVEKGEITAKSASYKEAADSNDKLEHLVGFDFTGVSDEVIKKYAVQSLIIKYQNLHGRPKFENVKNLVRKVGKLPIVKVNTIGDRQKLTEAEKLAKAAKSMTPEQLKESIKMLRKLVKEQEQETDK